MNNEWINDWFRQSLQTVKVWPWKRQWEKIPPATSSCVHTSLHVSYILFTQITHGVLELDRTLLNDKTNITGRTQHIWWKTVYDFDVVGWLTSREAKCHVLVVNTCHGVRDTWRFVVTRHVTIKLGIEPCQWFIHPKIPSQGEGLGVIWWWFSFGESCCLSDHSKVARSKSMTMFVRDGAIVFVITRYCGGPQACKYFFIGSSVWSRL